VPATLKVAHKVIGVEVRRGTFDVVVDGKRAGSVELHGTFETPVEPGRHTLQVRNGRNSSRTQTFDAAEGPSRRLPVQRKEGFADLSRVVRRAIPGAQAQARVISDASRALPREPSFCWALIAECRVHEPRRRRGVCPVPWQNPACCPDLVLYARRSCSFASSTSSWSGRSAGISAVSRPSTPGAITGTARTRACSRNPRCARAATSSISRPGSSAGRFSAA